VGAASLGAVVGENVQRIRAERRLTQEEATLRIRAVGLMWSRSGVAALESAQREDVATSALLLLAAGLDVKPADLVAGEGDVRLTVESTVTREWLRDYLSGAISNVPVSVGSKAARAGLSLMPGERISFKADAELAQRLGLRPEDVYGAAERLWGHNLHQERERRLAELGDLSASERRVRRGHITRALAAELAPYLPNGEHSGDDA
jgi:transcriptional regulator with XRE-family HTH domain